MDNNTAFMFGAMLALLAAVWVMIDASRTGRSGFVTFLWGLATFLFLIAALPAWLLTRDRDKAAVVEVHCQYCGHLTDQHGAYCSHCGRLA